MIGPVVKGGRIKVGAVRPDERVNLAIDRDRVELIEIAQRAVELAFQHRPEVDCPDQAIAKLDPEAVRPHDLESFGLVDGMSHALYLLSEGLDLARWPACLKPVPGGEQLGLMNLAPRLNEAALPLGKVAADEFDRVDREETDIGSALSGRRWRLRLTATRSCRTAQDASLDC